MTAERTLNTLPRLFRNGHIIPESNIPGTALNPFFY